MDRKKSVPREKARQLFFLSSLPLAQLSTQSKQGQIVQPGKQCQKKHANQIRDNFDSQNFYQKNGRQKSRKFFKFFEENFLLQKCRNFQFSHNSKHLSFFESSPEETKFPTSKKMTNDPTESQVYANAFFLRHPPSLTDLFGLAGILA